MERQQGKECGNLICKLLAAVVQSIVEQVWGLKDNGYIIIMERAFNLKSEDLKPKPYLTLSSHVMLYKLPNLTEPQLSC